MRKVSVLIGLCMLVALALTVIGQEAGLPPLMQSNRMTMPSLQMNIMAKNAAGAAADAQKLQENFTKATDIFKALKSDDAAAMAKMQADDAAAVAKAVQGGNWDAATASAGAIQKRCGACHMAHREQLPDKTFKFKP
jgi:spermidine/putrescine-binding protein